MNRAGGRVAQDRIAGLTGFASSAACGQRPSRCDLLQSGQALAGVTSGTGFPGSRFSSSRGFSDINTSKFIVVVCRNFARPPVGSRVTSLNV
jgi:hypothetical protein